jgi:predicted aspartyl protease
MGFRRLLVVMVAGVMAGARPQSGTEAALRAMYEAHQWFELRDAIAGKSVAAVYSGAVASAFNRTVEADRALTQAVRDAATPDAANEVREALMNLDMRLGRSAHLVRLLDEALAVAPERADLRNMRALFRDFAAAPDQATAKISRDAFRCAVRKDGVYMPVIVNGKAAEWLFDSGFSTTSLNESEATLLGVRVYDTTAAVGDYTATTKTRVGVINRLTIGGSEVQNVPVLVFPDAQPPWNDRPAGQRGTIGLPIAAALQGVRWTSAGSCQFAPGSTADREVIPNLAFDGETPIARAFVGNRPVDVMLDTGNQAGTQLWQRFADEFPEAMAHGTKGTKHVEEIGGAREDPVVMLAALPLRLGGFSTTLRPANVLPKPAGDGFHHGNVGMEVLSRASAVTIDFRAMRLVIR